MPKCVSKSLFIFVLAQRNKIPPSPRKTPTPKRKVAQKNLVWAVEDLNLFVKKCVEKKERLCEDHVPLAVWKEISEGVNNPDLSWKVCQIKFNSMKKYFFDTLIPLEGFMGGSKWPHYENFCEIFEVPANVHSILADDANEAEPEVDPETGGE